MELYSSVSVRDRVEPNPHFFLCQTRGDWIQMKRCLRGAKEMNDPM